MAMPNKTKEDVLENLRQLIKEIEDNSLLVDYSEVEDNGVLRRVVISFRVPTNT